MNKLILAVSALSLLISCTCLHAQDTLPKFSVRNVGNKRVIIEWINKFQNTNQISIQRSSDSLRNFKTILTVPDPSNPQNGFADTKADNDHMYYRLYILLSGGVYLFSPTKRPVWDTMTTQPAATTKKINGMPGKPNTVIPSIPGDSTSKTNGISSRPKVEAWVPSKFVYTNTDGYIR